MPISPIDFISIAPKSQEVSHLQAGQEDKQAQANAMVSEHFQQQVDRNGRQTVQKSNADNEKYRYDAKEKGNNPYPKKKRKKGSEQKKKEEEKENSPVLSHFDVKF